MKNWMFLLGLLFSFSVSAQIYQAPLSRAIGGSGRAGLDSSDSALLNPALVPLANDHEVNFFYSDGYEGTGRHHQGWGLGATDSGAEVVTPGALHYIRTRNTGIYSSPVNGELWHFAVGKMFFENFTFGLSGYRWMTDPELDKRHVQWNGSLGGLYMFNRGFGVAYVLDNPFQTSPKVPVPLRVVTRQSIGSMYTLDGIVAFRFDISRDERYNPDKKMVYQAGIESQSFEFTTFRLGAKWDNLRNQNFVTAGLGFDGPRLKFDYVLEKNTRGTGGAVHGVDMRIPF